MLQTVKLLGAVTVVAALSACSDMDMMSADGSGAAGAAGGSGSTGQPQGTMSYFEREVGDRVFFAFDSHEITDEANVAIAAQAAWLSLFKDATVVVEGHCDERGTREYNLALGARRAAAVKETLMSFGVTEDRIETVSYGKERPVALCSAERCWKQNRRGVSVVRGVPGG